MKPAKLIYSVISTILITALVTVVCYTIPTSEISGKWKRSGSHISEYKGVVSANRIDYSLSFHVDSSYTYKCNHLRANGRFVVFGDTVTIKGPKKSMSRYIFSVDGNTLKLIKVDNNYIPTCVAGERKDAFAGAWHR